MSQTYAFTTVIPAQAAVATPEMVVAVSSDDPANNSKAPAVFTPGADGSAQPVATDQVLQQVRDALALLGTQTTLSDMLTALNTQGNQQVGFLGTPLVPVPHRTGVTTADTTNPTSPSVVGGALHFASPPGISAARQYVDYDISLTTTSGTGTALVQLMLWDSIANSGAGAWFGGAYTYLSTSAISPSIPTQTPPVSCPCVLRFETRGRPSFLKVLAISGTSVALTANACSV